MTLTGMTLRGYRSLRIVKLGLVALLGMASAGATAHAESPAASDPDPLSYIFLAEGNVTIMGDSAQLDRVTKLRNGHEPILWFRDGGREYVSRDPAMMAQLETLWKPVRSIADQQSKLAGEQASLAGQQSGIAAQQSEIGRRQGELGMREGALGSRDRSTMSDAERRDVERQRNELRDQQRALRDQMKELERPMRELSDKMKPLSREMTALSRKMEDANARAKVEVRAVMRRAVASGAAKAFP